MTTGRKFLRYSERRKVEDWLREQDILVLQPATQTVAPGEQPTYIYARGYSDQVCADLFSKAHFPVTKSNIRGVREDAFGLFPRGVIEPPPRATAISNLVSREVYERDLATLRRHIEHLYRRLGEPYPPAPATPLLDAMQQKGGGL